MLLTLGFAGVEGGVVLCFGDDGHLAIEAVGPDGCVEAVEDRAPAASTNMMPAAASHCGPCVDVALTTPAAAKAAASVKRAGAAPVAIAIATPRPPMPHLRAAISLRHSTPFISEKPNTVVIRC
jgi:hypothetical protein